ncbi:glycosyltransferase [Kineosporia sp. J2-2]|uniref:Glycosyltransferase n=1 Tax=Kineosporia corallincola TaxID=2835133 RepID=A0ABS5TM14_9ACTN|nr:glycosyltransferase [Kineosporia corallincola]MBT0772045.1 glycosyltransferase [Kineosporia corallincola]
MTPVISVVVCSLNGEQGIGRTVRALREQIQPGVEIVVVDDGSTDDTAAIAEKEGARVVRHATNRGLAAARNTGWRAATSDLVAFTDDDCHPAPDWTACLVAAARRHPDCAGFGGAVEAADTSTFVQRYLARNNPLAPLELALLSSDSFGHRLVQYLLRSGATDVPTGERRVASVAGAGMAFRRVTLEAAGGFDERFRFGGEEEDLCRRLVVGEGAGLLFLPQARVLHHFEPGLGDTLRRSRAYGRGNARMHHKHPGIPATVYPAPIGVLALALLLPRLPRTALALAVLAPQLLFSRWARRAVAERDPALLLYPYLQVMQEGASNLGWWEGHRAGLPEPGEPA